MPHSQSQRSRHNRQATHTSQRFSRVLPEWMTLLWVLPEEKVHVRQVHFPLLVLSSLEDLDQGLAKPNLFSQPWRRSAPPLIPHQVELLVQLLTCAHHTAPQSPTPASPGSPPAR
jgi:hypothetical protein